MLGKALLWPEPSLVFARGQQERIDDPKFGLITYGPYDRNVGTNPPDEVNVFLIAVQNQFTRVKALLDNFERNVPTKWKTVKFPFPGFRTLYRTKLSIPTKPDEAVYIRDEDLVTVLGASDFSKFSTEFIQVMRRKLQEAIEKSDSASNTVYFVQVPPNVASKADTFQQISGLGVRELIKVAGVQCNAKTQLITSNSLEPADMADNLWNLTLAAYVKAGGVPWKLKEIPPASMFIGMAYGIRKDEGGQTIFTGLAQVFNKFGEQVEMAALDFESGDYAFDPTTKSYHLNREPMRKLISAALERYTQQIGEPPATAVLHKTTDFNEEERNGALDSLKGTSHIDMVHVVESTLSRAFGFSETTSRGTFWPMDENRGLLYTTGWVESVATYPGIGSPSPLEVVRNYGATGLATLAKQIFALTKMDWDTTRVMIREPATVDYARRVADVIKAGLKAELLLRDIRYYL
jgi:hypothetical protein